MEAVAAASFKRRHGRRRLQRERELQHFLVANLTQAKARAVRAGQGRAVKGGQATAASVSGCLVLPSAGAMQAAASSFFRRKMARAWEEKGVSGTERDKRGRERDPASGSSSACSGQTPSGNESHDGKVASVGGMDERR